MSSLLVFPGQGAQRPGMLQGLPGESLSEACDVLGEDVRLLDSAEALRSTRAVQLCLLIAGVAAARQLSLPADYVAGLSIGAYQGVPCWEGPMSGRTVRLPAHSSWWANDGAC